MLSSIYTIDTKNNKRQENSDIQHVQHKNINMTWDYLNFPRHLVAAGMFEIRGINTFTLRYRYRFDP